jgi:hypothetical protein
VLDIAYIRANPDKVKLAAAQKRIWEGWSLSEKKIDPGASSNGQQPAAIHGHYDGQNKCCVGHGDRFLVPVKFGQLHFLICPRSLPPALY